MARLSPLGAAGLAVLATLWLAVILSAPASANEPASWPSAVESDGEARLYVLTFADQDVVQVAGQVLGVILKVPFEVDPAVNGKMSLVIEERLTHAQLLGVFEASLARNGVAIARQGETLRLIPRSAPPPASAAAGRRAGRLHRGDEMVSSALLYEEDRASRPGTSTDRPWHAGLWMPAIAALGLLGAMAAGFALAAAFAWAKSRSFGVVEGRRPVSGPEARKAVLDRLRNAGFVDRKALTLARTAAAQTGRPVEHVLNGMGVVSDKALVDAYAAVTGLPVWRPELQPPLLWANETGLAAEGLTRRGLVPVQIGPDRLTLATSDPLDDAGLADVAVESARKVTILICAPSDVRRAIAAV